MRKHYIAHGSKNPALLTAARSGWYKNPRRAKRVGSPRGDALKRIQPGHGD